MYQTICYAGSKGVKNCIIKICIINGNKIIKERKIIGHTDLITDIIQLNNDPFLICSCSHDSSLKIWDRISGKCLYTLQEQKSHPFIRTGQIKYNKKYKNYIIGGSYHLSIWKIGFSTKPEIYIKGAAHFLCFNELKNGNILVGDRTSSFYEYNIEKNYTMIKKYSKFGNYYKKYNYGIGNIKVIKSIKNFENILLISFTCGVIFEYDMKKEKVLKDYSHHKSIVFRILELNHESNIKKYKYCSCSSNSILCFFGKKNIQKNDHKEQDGLLYGRNAIYGITELNNGNVISGSHQGELMLWNTKNKKKGYLLKKEKFEINCVITLKSLYWSKKKHIKYSKIIDPLFKKRINFLIWLNSFDCSNNLFFKIPKDIVLYELLNYFDIVNTVVE